MKKISVIIPCYNAEKYVGKCLDSIVNQTVGIENMEVIVVDDASTDESVGIVDKFVKRYPQSIIHICLSQNLGQANARNIGIEFSHSKYLTFVDADDWVSLDAYEKLIKPTLKFEYDMVHCSYREYMEGVPPHDVIEGGEKCIKIKDQQDRIKFLSECRIGGIIGRCILKTEFIQNNDIKFKQFVSVQNVLSKDDICIPI